jgi:cytochrome oxidase assembly protein ShyY1
MRLNLRDVLVKSACRVIPITLAHLPERQRGKSSELNMIQAMLSTDGCDQEVLQSQFVSTINGSTNERGVLMGEETLSDSKATHTKYAGDDDLE